MDKGKKVAIIGMSGRFPDAGDLEEFYANLKQGRDSVRRISIERLRYSSVSPVQRYRHMASLDRIDYFDPAFFRISRKDADHMDPVQRTLLQMSCEAIENAGYNLDDLHGADMGIILGGKNESGQYYQELMKGNEDPAVFTGTLGSMSYGRIAYFLNVTGPAMMIDTACSSALVAIDQAFDRIVKGEIDYAIAGGISLNILFPFITSQGYLGSHAPDGRCKTFDAGADGIGSGEGGALFLLKRLDKALEDRDNIQGVILACAVNHDGGRSNGITAPSPEAQSQVIKKAWRKAGIEPETISYIETHGTGTKLGDPIEFRGITDAFREYTAEKRFCAISSVKTNIGHLGSGAGAAGLLKAVLSLKHRQLLPSIHFHTPNPFIDFENSAAYVHTTLSPWNGPLPRRCGVSAFGLSGTNAHLVLEEAPPPSIATTPDYPVVLKVSALNTRVLQDYAAKIRRFLQSDTISTPDVLYTLNTGRKEFPFRKAFYASDKTGLLALLDDFIGPGSKEPALLKDRHAILLFSPDGYDAGLAGSLCNKYDVFNYHFKTITDRPVIGKSARVTEFAYYFALFSLLRSWGVPVRTAIGAGRCRAITRLVTGTQDLASALSDYCVPDDEVNPLDKAKAQANPIDKTKMDGLVRNLLAKNDGLFLEMGAKGLLSDHLHQTGVDAKMPVIRLLDPASGHDPMRALIEMYNGGLTIDWKTFYTPASYRKVDAPTYPFEKIRCWFEEPLQEPGNDALGWIHGLDWIPSEIKTASPGLRGKKIFLLLMPPPFEPSHPPFEPSPILTALAGEGHSCIVVIMGDSYQENDPKDKYTIDKKSPADYIRLEKTLQRKGISPDGLIYVGTESRIDSFFTLFHLTKAFHAHISGRGFLFTVVTVNACRILRDEPAPKPFRILPRVFLKALLAEYSMLQVTGIDLSEQEADRAASAILNEMQTDDPVRFTAYRGGARYVQRLSPKTAAADEKPFEDSIRDSDVYIITGGAGGIGYEIAKTLAEKAHCHLILIGRTHLPDPAGDPAATPDAMEKMARVSELRKMGATVDYYAANLGERETILQVFAEIAKQHRRVRGIFHAAGIGSGGVSIKNREASDVYTTFDSKVAGTMHLGEFSASLDPEFFVCFSSIGAIVPAANSADYSAANAFQDTFAEYMNGRNGRYLSIAWADWKETGLSYRKSLRQSEQDIDAREAIISPIYTRDGIRCLFALIVSNYVQVAVVKADLASFRINPYFVVGVGDPATSNPPTGNPTTGNPSNKPEAPVKSASANDASPELETRLASIWGDILRLDTVQPDDDFYRMGGHSLNLAQLILRIEKYLGIRVEMKELLRHHTIRKLAARLHELKAAGHISQFREIPVAPLQSSYPVSHTQRRFWMTQYGSSKGAYHVTGGYRITGELDGIILGKAFKALIKRHESLRTTYLEEAGELRQVIRQGDEDSFVFPLHDISAQPDPESEAKRIAVEEAAVPFDLSKGPLIRACLLYLGDGVHILLVTLHHIVSDGRSMEILRNEVLAFYKSLKDNKSVGLPPLRIQYKDFSCWQNDAIQRGDMDAMQRYWRRRMTGHAHPVTIPHDFDAIGHHPFAARRDVSAGVLSLPVDDGAITILTNRRTSINSSIFTTVFSLLMILIHRLTGESNIVVGTPVSGKLHADLEDQIGNYLNTLLLRTIIDQEDSYDTLSAKIGDQLLLDYDHQLYPLDLLVNDLGFRDEEPFRLGFTWNRRDKVNELKELQWTVDDFNTGYNRAKADIWFFGTEWEDGLTVDIVYRTSSYRRASIDLMAHKFHKIVHQTAEFPTLKIHDLDLETEPEKMIRQKAIQFDLDI